MMKKIYVCVFTSHHTSKTKEEKLKRKVLSFVPFPNIKCFT